MTTNRLEHSSFLVLLAGISILLFMVFAPFFTVLALAVVSAVLLHKPYERLTKALGGWQSGSAVLTVGMMLVFFIVPLFFLSWEIFNEAQNLYVSMSGQGTQYLTTIEQAIEAPIQHVLPAFTFNMGEFIGNALALISSNLGSLVYQTLYVIAETFLFMLALFFFLRDGRSLLVSFVEMSPLGKEVTTEILEKMYGTVGSVIKGTFVNALIRFACISVAFYLFGVPNALLWGSIGGIVGAIPGLGTPFAIVPAAIYAYLQGDLLGMLGLAVSGILIMVLVDNMLTAYFFGKGLAVSPLFVLFSIFGGIVFFGPLGFILGPLVLSTFLSVVRVYRVE